MFCYNCGCHLSEHDFCTACGVDVSLYKKIMRLSNTFYNLGLEKAQVRDLSGAVNSLRQSLKLNKANVEARNLLGLVYFEMGEVVAALSEWVISKNLRPEKNIADDYINMIQSNASRLESINSTIKKYNHAYAYCVQDSKDLAIIQLKKVLSLNPKFIRAHQLLALLYMDAEHWEKAKRELERCLKIDRNNTLSLRYLNEVEHMLAPEENEKPGKFKPKKEETIRYQSDNEIIIQPINVREPKSIGFGSVLNILMGLIIGAAAMYFLAVPATRVSEQEKAKEESVSLANQLDVKSAAIQELETKLDNLTIENTTLSERLKSYEGEGGTMQVTDDLLSAATTYFESQDLAQTAVNLENISNSVQIENTTEAFRKLYYALLSTIGPDVSKTFMEEGYAFFRNEDYDSAITKLRKAVEYDAGNSEALFHLANSYRKNNNIAEAIETYDQVIEKFPESDWAVKAKEYEEEINSETAESSEPAPEE